MDFTLLRRVFPGDSPLALELRDVDWNAEKMGTPDTWSPVVRTAISICIASPSPMQVYWGPSRTVIYNAATIRLLGRQPRVPAQSGREIFGDEVWRFLGPTIERAFADGEPTACEGLRMRVPQTGSGGESVIAFTFAPLIDASGTVVGAVGSCAAEPAVHRAPSSTPQLRDKDVFLSRLSHELRNPLSALMTTLQALTLRAPSPDTELMERSVRRLSTIVDNLIDISRIARARLELHPTRCEVAVLVDRALALAAPIISERRTQVFVRVPRVGLRVAVDLERIAQAIANVLGNAARYSEPGSRVWVETAREQDRVRVVIKDEGSGIEPECLATIFEAFSQPAELRPRTAGLGLGLAIARSLVELHDGALTVTSAGASRGTECVIELPLEIELAASVSATVSRRRLLVVEDNDDAARALKNALEALGYVVALAHDGPIALNVARAFDPDVVLLDIGLPVMDGWELAKRLRALRDAPVVALTALDRDADKQRSAEAGFVEHLVKPIDLATLHEVLEGLPLRERAPTTK